MLTDIIDFLIGVHEDYFKPGLTSFCDLETAETETDRRTGKPRLSHALVAEDGSYVSITAVRGRKKLSSAEDLQTAISRLSAGLKGYFKDPGHAIQVVFARDPSKAASMVQGITQDMRVAAEAKGLDIDDIIGARKDLYSRRLVKEDMYIAIWSRPSLLSASQGTARDEKRKKRYNDAPGMVGGQDILCGEELIYSRHKNFTKAVFDLFSELGFVVDVLNAHAAVRAIKSTVYPDEDLSNWRARLPLDGVIPRELDGVSEKNLGGGMVPPLSEQIFSRTANKSDTDKYRVAPIGDLLFRSFDMTLAPESLKAFDHLINKVESTANDMPWRISFLLDSGSQGRLFWKNLFALILWVFNKGQNGRIRDATNYLIKYAQQGNVILGMRVNLATWVPQKDEHLLVDRALSLKTCFEDWGSPQASEVAGDPHQSTLSSALGLAVASTATTAFPPLPDAMSLLPLSRPASAFRKGPVLFRSPDGLPMPYAPGSSEQPASLELYYAPPRSGKSVTLNTVNLGAALQATKDKYGAKLPLQTIIDIGPSSRGYISLLQEALPPHRRHEVMYKKLQNHEKDGINIFDTQLGNRFPIPNEKAVIENLLCLLCTAPDEKPDPSLAGALSAAVDNAYNRLSDDYEPNKYVPHRSVDVDEALTRLDFQLDQHVTWWEVVDFLYEQDEIRLATLAQRFAVPVLSDIIVSLREDTVKGTYDRINTVTGTPLLDYVKVRLSEATNLYPILKGYTQLEISTARILSLNLEDICPAGPGPAAHQRCIMYMLARYIGARSYFIADTEGDTIHFYNERYHAYHRNRLEELAETPKRLVYDEYHRTDGAEFVRAQLLMDVREGPKYGVQIALSSQMMRDFSEDVIENATAVFIMRAGQGRRVLEDLCERFGLNDTARAVVEHHLNRPGPFLAFFVTKSGKFLQHLVNDISPVELWAFSTTPEDMAIRGRLTLKVGAKQARAMLADRFPEGTAKPTIDRLKEDGGMAGHDDLSNVYEQVVDDMLRYNKVAA